MIRGMIDSFEKNDTYLRVELPKFEVRQSTSLKIALQELGVSQAFGSSADFDAMTEDQSVWLDDVVHEATVGIDEDGVSAAAATGISSVASDPPNPFIANRPFFFFLYDEETGEVLFMGQVMDPGKE
jgi:serpin B